MNVTKSIRPSKPVYEDVIHIVLNLPEAGVLLTELERAELYSLHPLKPLMEHLAHYLKEPKQLELRLEHDPRR